MTFVPFLHSLKDIAPKADQNLRWPIDGLAYVSAFMGPLSAGPIVGLLARDWRAIAIGLLIGIGITYLNAWLCDRFLEPRIARYQRFLQKGVPWVLANIVAFAWVIMLCALSMLGPVLVLGSGVVAEIR
jgi:hypothetical protein